MKKAMVRAVVELLVAGVALIGAVAAWLSASSTAVVAPVLEGEPETVSVLYSPPLIVLAFILATVAGVLVVLAVARLRRA